MKWLDKHSSGAAGGVEDDAVVRLDDVHEELHERKGREKLAVVVGFLDREFGEEVFVDAAENIAGGGADALAVEQAHEFLEHLRLEDAIILRKDIPQRLEIPLDGVHGGGDKLRKPGGIGGGPRHDGVESRLLGQKKRAAAQVVGGLDFAPGHTTGSLIFLDLPRGGIKAVRRMAQEDDPEHRHEVVAGGQLGIRAKIVRRLPEVGFEFGKICHK